MVDRPKYLKSPPKNCSEDLLQKILLKVDYGSSMQVIVLQLSYSTGLQFLIHQLFVYIFVLLDLISSEENISEEEIFKAGQYMQKSTATFMQSNKDWHKTSTLIKQGLDLAVKYTECKFTKKICKYLRSTYPKNIYIFYLLRLFESIRDHHQ